MTARDHPDATAADAVARASLASRFELIADPAAEWARRIDMIRRARHFLYLSTYYIGHDRWALEMLDALADARRRGVAVLLGIDAFGQRLGSQILSAAQRTDLDARLAGLGPGVHFYHPATRLQRLCGAGQHVKIQLSEAGEALHGSSNLSSRSFDAGQWKEVGFSLQGPAALQAFDVLAALFPGATQPAHRALLDTAAGGPGTIPIEYWWHDPNRPATPWAPLAAVSNPLTERLVASIDTARESILASSFYFKPCTALAAAFERAARRGVAVEVFHSHRDALVESDLPWMAAAAGFRRWLAAGMTIHESRRGEHSKLLLVDEAELAIGSYNFEHAAHDRLAELMVFVRDRSALQAARDLFDQLRADPDNVTMDASGYARLPWTLRARTALARPLRRWV